MQLTNMPRDQHTKIDSNSLIPTIKKNNLTNHPQDTIANPKKTLVSLIAPLRSKGKAERPANQCLINQPKTL